MPTRAAVSARSGSTGPPARLTFLNSQPSRGAHPCHLAVDRAGTHLLVANYTGGTLAVLPLASDGSLGSPSQVVRHKGSSVNTERQSSPHAHSIDLDAGNGFAISSDLGADRLFVYRYDATERRPVDRTAARHCRRTQAPGRGTSRFTREGSSDLASTS